MHDPILRQVFYECKEKNKFVFEVCDDIFGDKLTAEEMGYWSVYGIISSAYVYDVDITNMSFENAMDEIQEAARKRKAKWDKSKKGSLPKKK